MEVSPPKARLFVTQSLSKGVTVMLGKEQSHYLLQVMRLKEGASAALFNGRDGEWWGRLSEAGKKSASIEPVQQMRAQQAEPDIWLCFAPIKHGRIDFLVQKAVELGASHLQPVETKRTIVSRVNLDRLQANAVEAAEQSERLSVPEIAPMVKLNTLLAEWPAERLLIIADETGGGLPPHALLPELIGQKLAVLIGPEGGFAPEEIQQISALKSVRRLSLGPRILRADTAALAALSCVQALCGDWREGVPSFRGEDDGE